MPGPHHVGLWHKAIHDARPLFRQFSTGKHDDPYCRLHGAKALSNLYPKHSRRFIVECGKIDVAVFAQPQALRPVAPD